MTGAAPVARPLLAAVACAALGCASSNSGPPVEARGWRTYVAHEGDVKLNGVACGDLDPASPGDELVACGADGTLVLVRRVVVPAEGDNSPPTLEFQSTVVLRTEGELIQVAVGDLDPASPGDEAVAVGVLQGGEDDGGRGVAWLLRAGPTGWDAEVLLEDDALLHAVLIGDLDPERPGPEVALAGFTQRLLLMGLAADGAPEPARELARLPGNAKGLARARGGLAVACDDGTLALAKRGDDGTWTLDDRWRIEVPLARVAGRGDQVLVCANDGVLRLFQTTPDFTYSSVTRCVVLDDRLRGAVFADVDPTSPGEEAATAGYDGTVRVVRLEEWPDPDPLFPPDAGLVEYRVRSTIAAEDTDKLHHLAAGDFAGLGTCLATAGYSGRVLVVQRIPEAR